MLYSMDPPKGPSVRVVEKDARGYVEMVKPEDPLRSGEPTVSPWGQHMQVIGELESGN